MVTVIRTLGVSGFFVVEGCKVTGKGQKGTFWGGGNTLLVWIATWLHCQNVLNYALNSCVFFRKDFSFM